MRERQSAERRGKGEESKGSERDVRKLLEVRNTIELERLRGMILKPTNTLLKGSSIKLGKEGGEIVLKMESEATRGKSVEGFDLETLTGDPLVHTDSRPVGENAYVVTERKDDRAAVRPDGQGRYPEREDLRAALAHDLFFVMRCVRTYGITPEDAALVAHHYRRTVQDWKRSATVALLAVYTGLTKEEAEKRAARVVDDLIKVYEERKEALSKTL